MYQNYGQLINCMSNSKYRPSGSRYSEFHGVRRHINQISNSVTVLHVTQHRNTTLNIITNGSLAEK